MLLPAGAQRLQLTLIQNVSLLVSLENHSFAVASTLADHILFLVLAFVGVCPALREPISLSSKAVPTLHNNQPPSQNVSLAPEAGYLHGRECPIRL